MLFQLTALVILLAFYSCYLFKAIAQRKKGIRTNQMGKDKTGAVKRIEVSLQIFAYLVPISEVISILSDSARLPIPFRILGAALSIIGTAVFIISVLTMRDSWRAGVSKTEKTELITDGIYQFSRNPAFLGFDLVYIGILLMFFNLPLLAVSVVGMILFHLQIVYVEEKFLIDTFSSEYLSYKQQVFRYIGRRKLRK